MSQFQQMMNGQSSPLGTLSLFPQEVRDLVYQEVVEHPAECCLHEVCSSAVDLTIKLCNKQINREVAAYSAKQPTAYACKHWSFFIRLPSFKELSKTQVHHNVIEHIIQRDVGLGNRRHDIAYAKRLRFIGFQGSDVPLGVVIHLQLPGGSTVAVHGASSERTRVVTKHMQHLLRDFDHRAPPNTIDSAGQPVDIDGGPRTVLQMLDLTIIAEDLRDVVEKPLDSISSGEQEGISERKTMAPLEGCQKNIQ